MVSSALFLMNSPSGRHRFTASFIELLFKNDFKSPHRLFNKYIKTHADYDPLDYDDDLLHAEPELEIQVDLITFSWDKLRASM